MNSPLDELLVCESVSLSHSLMMSAAAILTHSPEVGSVGESCVNDVLIISVAGPLYYNETVTNYYIIILKTALLWFYER